MAASAGGNLELSVVIPTYRRARQLSACLAGLSRQTLERERFEVLVGFDGADEEGAEAARRVWGTARAGPGLEIVQCPRAGYNATRNALVERARGRVLVSLNDDVVPEPELLGVHLAEQDAAASAGRPAVITGYSPWKRYEDETLFDRLVRETSMVFFYDRMLAPPGDAPGPQHDWGFRHCWGLNFSAPLTAVREVGGFTAFPMAYGYDDIEIAFRLKEHFGMPVLFRPQARAEHDHRYGPREVLEREFKLGQSAWLYAGEHPAFARAVFGREIRAAAEVAYSREFVARERGAAERLEKSFLALGDMPGGSISGPHAAALVNLVYEQHLLLKRYTWRRGLLDAASRDQSAEPKATPEREPITTP